MGSRDTGSGAQGLRRSQSQELPAQKHMGSLAQKHMGSGDHRLRSSLAKELIGKGAHRPKSSHAQKHMGLEAHSPRIHGLTSSWTQETTDSGAHSHRFMSLKARQLQGSGAQKLKESEIHGIINSQAQEFTVSRDCRISSSGA